LHADGDGRFDWWHFAVPLNAPITQIKGRNEHNYVFKGTVLDKGDAVPLVSGSSQKSISKNIATERRAHPSMDPKQAAAIAYAKARGDMGQITEVKKTADKWLASVKSPLGIKVFEIPLDRALDEGDVRTEVEKLMASNIDWRDDNDSKAKIDVAVAEMDALVGAISEVGRKVDAMTKKNDALTDCRLDAGFEESKHPRAGDGKFGSGSGGGSSSSGGAEKKKIAVGELKKKLEGMSYEALHGALKNADVDPAIKKYVEKELDDRGMRGAR
jgi:hypothetical protein